MATADDLLIEYANHEILKGKKGRKQTLNDKRKLSPRMKVENRNRLLAITTLRNQRI